MRKFLHWKSKRQQQTRWLSRCIHRGRWERQRHVSLPLWPVARNKFQLSCCKKIKPVLYNKTVESTTGTQTFQYDHINLNQTGSNNTVSKQHLVWRLRRWHHLSHAVLIMHVLGQTAGWHGLWIFADPHKKSGSEYGFLERTTGSTPDHIDCVASNLANWRKYSPPTRPDWPYDRG